MRTIIIVFGSILISVMVFFLLIVFTTTSIKQNKKVKNELIEYVKTKSFDSLTNNQKRDILSFFGKGSYQYSDLNFKLNQEINSIIKSSVRYPETLQIMGFDGEYHKDYEIFTLIDEDYIIDDVDKGTIFVKRKIISENKLGQNVKNTFFITIKFDGKNYNIIDIKTE